MKVIKQALILILSIGLIFFATLTIKRLTWDYNENGVYFDGETTYDQDAILVYGLITGTLLIIVVGLQLIWKRPSTDGI